MQGNNLKRIAWIFLGLFLVLALLVKINTTWLAFIDSPLQSMDFAMRNGFFTLVTKLLSSLLGPVGGNVIFLLIFFYFIYIKWQTEAFFLSFNMILFANALPFIVKEVIRRARPASSNWLTSESGFSFPSGHASVSMTLCLSLTLIFMQHLKYYAAKRNMAIVLGLLVFLVGFSRVYLGVHYPTDILGAWFLTAGFVLLFYTSWQRRKQKWKLGFLYRFVDRIHP